MRIESYEQLKASLEAQEAKRQEDNGKRAVAAADVATAKKHYDDLMEQAAAGGASDEQNAAVSRAHGAVLVAEKRQQQVLAQLGEPNVAAPNAARFSLQGVMSEIRQQINDGRLLAEMQPALDELAAIRAQYLDKLAEVLKTRSFMNRELLQIQHEARSMVESATGQRSDFGVLGPAQLALDELRKWVWLQHDLADETNRLDNKAYEIVNGPVYKANGVIVRDKIVLPDNQQPKPAGWKAPVHHQTQVIGTQIQ